MPTQWVHFRKCLNTNKKSNIVEARVRAQKKQAGNKHITNKHKPLFNNKGEFDPRIAASFAVLLIIISISGVILSNLRTSVSQTSTTLVSDLQLTASGSGQVTSLGNINIIASPLFENITNATNVILGAPNVTVNLLAGTANFSSTFQNQAFNVTYNFTDNVRTGAYNVSTNGLTGVDNFSEMAGTLGIALVAVLIIGLLGVVILLMRR